MYTLEEIADGVRIKAGDRTVCELKGGVHQTIAAVYKRMAEQDEKLAGRALAPEFLHGVVLAVTHGALEGKLPIVMS